jgi:Fungal specific transcription factor domain
LVALYPGLVSNLTDLSSPGANFSSFAAVALGLPRLLKDNDIETEEPANIDDENVSERGFQATLPGEHTKISSALALFRASRLLGKVLDEVYPAAGSRDLSLSRIASLADELDAWQESLPAHLRLEFIQDKINFNVTSDRSPLLVCYLHLLADRPLTVPGACVFSHPVMYLPTSRSCESWR